MTQEDAPTNPSNGDADPIANVQRELQQSGTDSCEGTKACDAVTPESEIGDNSCTSDSSCSALDGTYNDNNTRVCCLLCYMSTQLTE